MPKKQTKKKDITPGTWARVRFTDVGCLDGIVTQVDDDDTARVYFPATETLDGVDLSMIVKLGNRVRATETGLD